MEYLLCEETGAAPMLPTTNAIWTSLYLSLLRSQNEARRLVDLLKPDTKVMKSGVEAYVEIKAPKDSKICGAWP
jgi:hypothetical protein